MTSKVAVSCLSNYVHVLRSKGDGTLLPSTRYRTGALTVSMVAADLSADGRLDIATLNQLSEPSAQSVTVLLNQCLP